MDLKGRLLFAFLSLMLSETTSGAQLQVEVRVNVQRGCLLVSQVSDASLESAGLLNFGSTARLDDPTSTLDAQLLSARLPVWNAT